uniref:Uncharacterized protein n=1 Tax=Candidatus Kentrum sp. LPFa TaxID=2126335 RepID=A0A450XTX7_9GAMM|nr:MAG: hypothetical protein BECKLPF1236A_GA0070988_101974 [Candidatus Kentron sp. LPFa]VFK32715.1 MAG: hypothetical protein BECKLPF1236C_GA0070990_101786 [Candidatus Kentron sp. LPFa]
MPVFSGFLFSLQNQIFITFDFGGASLCHEILHFVQKSQSVTEKIFDKTHKKFCTRVTEAPRSEPPGIMRYLLGARFA